MCGRPGLCHCARCGMTKANIDMSDDEENRLTARAARYMRVGTNVGTIAAKVAGQRLFGMETDDRKTAAELAAALGGLKGPIMKVAQLLSTIPEALPKEYAQELSQLQSQAPPMSGVFVKRRMIAELGAGWSTKFKSFDLEPAASASLGQVHRAVHHDGAALATKLQYPDMQSAVEADLSQLRLVFNLHGRMSKAIDTSQIMEEIAERLREELDYDLESRHMRLYHHIFRDDPTVRVPEMRRELSTKRLLTMNWLDGKPLLSFKGGSLEDRNAIAKAMFRAWWLPFSRYGVIHGDPHLGNYTIFEDGERPAGVNLLDYGCIRKFNPSFIAGVVNLRNGLLRDDRDAVVNAYETWGFKGLTNELIDTLSIWARFIYAPLLDDRERTIAEGVSAGEYGRKEAFTVHKALKDKGPVTVPREFVFMDRAAIGLGGVFLHLDAKMNWFRLFEDMLGPFDAETVRARQVEAFGVADVPLPA
jgi:predicted unusual protein kinase regulating ubiquinone biosynthesis (AarF/ABC1/UbiB family)